MIPAVAERTAELPEICHRYHVARLDLFGKAVTADSITHEDNLNFLVEFQSLPPGDYVDAYFGLMESLEQLLGLPVQMTTDSAIKNPYFRHMVEKSRVNLYAA